MRRTVGWVLGLATTVALTGVAGASTRVPAVSGVAAAGVAVSGVAVSGVGAAGGAEAAPGREAVGVLEPVVRRVERSETFRYPGASYVKVHFASARLRPGDYLTVADASGAEVSRYDVAALARPEGRWAMSVAGDTAVVSLHRARSSPARSAGLAATVDRVARGFTAAERSASPPAAAAPGSASASRVARRAGPTESICGRDEKADAVCYKASDPTAYHRSKAVARLLINGVELCTAWRIGPKNRLMTNNHCLATSADAYDTEVWFNYMCSRCGGFEVFRPTKVWGERVLATDDRLDYTLFTVDNFATVEKFGFLELDLRQPPSGEALYIPQHPGGDPTMITKGANCGVDDPAYDGYDTATDISYYCDTEGGSSGSPVLSVSTDKVLALHHFGGCPNSGVRMDLIGEEIAALL